MPNTTSAQKAFRQSLRRRKQNITKKVAIKAALKKTVSVKELPLAYKAIDKAVKTGVIHRNKAARLKSRAAKFVALKK